jgi:hypothetical protein
MNMAFAAALLCDLAFVDLVQGRFDWLAMCVSLGLTELIAVAFGVLA